MVAYKFDDPDLEKTVRQLVTILEDNGAMLAPDMVISCENGYLSILITGTEFAKGECLINLPVECLLPVNDVVFGVSGDDIIIKSVPDDYTDLRCQLLDLMIEIYNKTGKLRDFEQESIWRIFKDEPAILDRLCTGRQGKRIDEYLEKGCCQSNEGSLANDFVGTRTLNALLDVNTDLRRSVIMPVIEFINHSAQSPIYNMVHDKDMGVFLSIMKDLPIEGSQECFVSYGRYDAYDMYMTYNYVEKNSYFVRSIPLEVKLSGLGVLKIGGHIMTAFHEDVPENVSDLENFLPNIISHSPNLIDVGYILIPSEYSPNALRRVLRHLINTMNDNIRINHNDMVRIILGAELEILNANLDFYRDMEVFAKSYADNEKYKEAVKPLLALARLQIDKINAYPLWDKVLKQEKQEAVQ